jgi:hypothetical protein
VCGARGDDVKQFNCLLFVMKTIFKHSWPKSFRWRLSIEVLSVYFVIILCVCLSVSLCVCSLHILYMMPSYLQDIIVKSCCMTQCHTNIPVYVYI